MLARATVMAMDGRMVLSESFRMIGRDSNARALSCTSCGGVAEMRTARNGKLGKCFFYISPELVKALPFDGWAA